MEQHAAAGLPPHEHVEWAKVNLDRMREHLDRYESELRRGVCALGSLLMAYRDNYGVMINALDADMPALADASKLADKALMQLICDCHKSMRKARGDVRAATAMCARDYAQVREVVRYGE